MKNGSFWPGKTASTPAGGKNLGPLPIIGVASRYNTLKY